VFKNKNNNNTQAVFTCQFIKKLPALVTELAAACQLNCIHGTCTESTDQFAVCTTLLASVNNTYISDKTNFSQ